MVTWLSAVDAFPLKKGEKIFPDKNFVISDFAEELEGMHLLRFPLDKQVAEGTVLSFECKQPVNLLVGYLNTERKEFAEAPTLETDASANHYGQADVKIANVLAVSSRGTVNIHSYSFPEGKHTLNLGKGGLLVFGFIDARQALRPHNAGIGATDVSNAVDWLFY
jgi:hypothetical protein